MLIEKFEETVEAFSQRIAIKMETETFTYGQLNQYANQVAAQIIASAGWNNKGKQAALLFEHGADMIIGLIAALKANTVYVPLDCTYPENRLAYMLEDSETSLILTNTNNLPLAQRLARKIKGKIEIMDIRETGTGQLEGNANRTVSGEAPAYILYTSGSTGRPKGVIQNHANVLYYTRNWMRRFSITAADRMTLLTAFSHDGFVQDLWAALLSGAALYPYDVKNILERTRLSEFIKNETITIWHSVPTLFRYFTDSLTPGEIFPHLRFILLGGEPLRKHDFDIFKTYFPNAALANVYGQTESSVSSIALYTQEDVFGLPILGEPLDKTEILLVTEEGEILEDMGTGEIIIACDHLAPGYWQDDESTREKFTLDPDLGKLYWTGDLGRLKGNGEITIISRIDLQIKIRGFRVEVGEIETVLLQHKAVNQAAVILRETQENEPYLCCYFTSKKPVNPAQLREYLLHQVPDYMIPRTFIKLGCLPLTPSGKTDRKALPDPETGEVEKEYKPPVTGIERQLAEIWHEVLNIKTGHQPIGIEDNFFELGGHSLRAIRLIARVHKAFQVKLELEEVFSFPGLRELAHLIDSKGQESFKAIHLVEKKQFYPLSSAQKRLYFLQQMVPGGTGYNLSDIMELEEEIEIKKVEETFRKLILRHESLRTSFHMIESQPMQRIHGEVKWDIEYYDLEVTGAGNRRSWGSEGTRGLAPLSIELATRIPQAAAALISSFVRPFDLSRAPLFRIGVIRLDENKHVFMMDMHHIISDGTSLEIFIEDFKRLYEDRGLLSLKLQYKDYAQWQRGEINRGVLKPQEAHWLKEFSSDPPVLQLPIDYQRPLIQSFEGDIIRFALEKEVSQGLKRLAQQEQVTLYMVLLAVVNVLLFKLSSQEDIVIGTPVEGRRHADLEGIIGMFVNTLTLRNYPQGEKPWARLLKEIREKTMKAFENQEYPFEELVDRAAVNRDMSRNPLFDVMFALHNQSTLPPEMLKVMKKGRYASIPFRHNRSKFDLTFHAIEAGEILVVSVEYSTKLFKKETIQRIIRYFQVIVSSITENSSRKLSEINILSKEEIEQLLVEFNRTDAQYPRHKTIHQLFKEQVEKNPDHIAVVGIHHLHESTLLEVTRGLDTLNALVTITYRELDQRSDQLAYLLAKKGIVPDTIVGIMIERSIEMTIGILGILKAGGAYMPIDPEYPEDRVEYMLTDSSAKVLLTDNLSQQFNCQLSIINCQLSMVNEIPINRRRLNNSPKEAYPHLHLQPAPVTCLAYIIYTSGTTGRPKGTLIRHYNVVRLMINDRFRFDFNIDDTWTLFHSYCFDFSVWEMYGALLYGGTLVIVPRMIAKDTTSFLELLKREKVTVLNQTPSAFYQLMIEELKAEKNELNLKYVIFGGEALNPSRLNRWKRQYPETRLINMYGITETTVHVTYKEILSQDMESPASCIGSPIPTLSVYVMDSYFKLQPLGVPGELWVGGEGVCRGYLNHPELTAEKFCLRRPGGALFEKTAPVKHLDSPRKNFLLRLKLKGTGKEIEGIDHMSYMSYMSHLSYIYKTGDLVKMLPCGEMEYLGRIDQQVKIRGHRIEPGEIEKQILTYKQQKIKAAVIIPREDWNGDPYLCGYLLAEHGIDISNLKKYLTHTLPDYMVPPFFVQLKEIPITSSGKVDKRALPGPEKGKREDGFTAPENEVEQELAVLWSAVLGIDAGKIGTFDNFFELGGHSLNATQLTARIHKIFNIKVPLPEFFKTPSINGIAQYLQRAAEDQFAVIEKAEPREYYPLSSAQKRLYVLQQMEEESTVYNMPLVIPIPMTGEIDIEKLDQIFRTLIARHESLRTSFHMVDNQPVQQVHDEVEFKIEYYDWQVTGAGDRCNFIRPFDLSLAPLLRVGLAELPHTPTAFPGHPCPGTYHSQEGKEYKYILMVDIHHIISDGVSLEILSHEFTILNNGQQVPELPIQYKDYALWQNRRRIRESTIKQEAYWLKVLEDGIPVLRLPYDFPRPAIQDFAGGRMNFKIEKQESPGLRQLALTQGITLYMVLLAAFTLLMSKLSGQEDIIIGTPTAGRQHADLEGVIGMFVNSLVMRNQPCGEKTFNTFLSEVKKNTLEAFENQDYQFEDLVEKVVVNRDASRNPLFDVMFAMQHVDVPMQNSLSSAEKQVPYPFAARVSKFDLTLECTDAGEILFFIIDYATSLFKPDTIRRFIVYFKQIVSTILTHPDLQIAEIEILTEQEKHRVLHVFNDTRVDFPSDKTIHQLFEESVERTPDHIALVGQGAGCSAQSAKSEEEHQTLCPVSCAITYKELNEKSNQLAHLLGQKGKAPDTIVGIMVHRSIEMVIGILGILKSGGAYLPIDPEYPEERIKYMLKDSGAKILVTVPGLPGKFEKLSLVNYQLLIVNEKTINSRRHNTPPQEVSPHLHLSPAPATYLAYILYTSGSTGKPKGVMVEHRSVVNILYALSKEYPILEKDTYLLKTSILFDVSVTELLGWFWHGGRLALLEKGGEIDPSLILDSIARYHVTHINFVPSLFTVFIDHLTPRDIRKLSTLKYIFLAGETLLTQPVEKSRKLTIGIVLENIYGPTEATIYASRYSLRDWQCSVTSEGIESKIGTSKPNIPIGKPLPNIKLYILDKYDRLQCIGAAGELCISGQGPARGYLNNPELTATKLDHDLWDYRDYHDEKTHELQELTRIGAPSNEKFLRGESRCFTGAVFSKSAPPGCRRQKIYKTGDRGRWLPDRNIEFLGRIDSQIKIRGFRIEPGEIESQLLNYKDITGAVVILREDEVGDKHLCAYIVSDKEISIPLLKEYLSHSLPYYMIPSPVIQVEKVPLTTHGKVNRKALPKPLIEKPTAFVAPRDWWEEQMALLWAGVLGVSKEILSIDANFFEMGGQSLKATVLITKIHAALEVKIPLAAVFKTPTIRGLAGYIKKTAPKQGYTIIEPAESKEYYALSPTQKGIYILQRLDPSGTAYHIPFFLEIKGEVDVQRFEEAFRGLIKRHGSLRTSFDIVNGEPVQKVHDKVEFEIEYHGAKRKAQSAERGGGCHAPSAVRCARTIKYFIRPFELSDPPLFRVGMIRLQEKKHILMVDIHHIAADGTSINILVGDFIALYQGKELPAPLIQYKDYCQWKNSRQWREVIAKQEMVWLREFEGQLPLLNLPLDFPRPPVQEFAGSSLAFELSPQETQAIKNFALKERVTIYMMVLSVFILLMAKLSGQEDIIVGTPAAGRNHENLQSIVGMFVNTLALRNFPVFYKTFKEFLYAVKEKTLTAFENQDYPFEELVVQLGSEIPRNKGRNPLFDVMVAPQDFETTAIDIPGLTLEPYKTTGNNHRTAKFDLTLIETETPDQLFFTLVYRTCLFKEETIQRFINYFKKVFTIVEKNPQIRIGEIEIITESERQQILREFNDTSVEYPGNKTLHQLFEERVKRAPDNIAAIGEMQRATRNVQSIERDKERHAPCAMRCALTYHELNEKADQLAYVLREKDIKPDTIVGIMVERSIEMIISLLGILKAGGAYMPIDPNYPEERINYMLADSGANLLVTTNFLNNYLFTLPCSHLRPSAWFNAPVTCLAYVIYTSGSTGKPFGVMVEHRNAVNVIRWFGAKYQLDGNTHVLQMSDYTFDPSVDQIFAALTRGAVLYLISKEELVNVELLRYYIENHQIHLVNFVPKLLNHLLGTGPKLKSIKAVICGGERLEDYIKDNILGKGYDLYNHYGPTEAAIDVTVDKCSGAGTGNIIGKPIANVNCYIVVRNNHLSPIGMPGELWVAGAGVARGYLNNPELTADRFRSAVIRHSSFVISSPLKTNDRSQKFLPDDRFFRTGDLARWLSDGSLEFLGRMDYQVKIRGFRVELGEIESHLHRINGVKNAVVTAHEGQNNEKYLCAYVVAEEAISMSHLKDELTKRLPSYMIPAFFVPLEEIPMTTIGKLNRKALPKPVIKKPTVHLAPRDWWEEQMALQWAEVLGVAKEILSIDTNFFEIGGHSLKATILAAKIHKTFNVKLPLVEIFKQPFIRGQAGYIKNAVKDEYVPITPVEKQEYYDLSSAQKRLFILQQLEPGSTSYNMPQTISLADETDIKKLERGFIKLIERHESLRTSLFQVDGKPVQKVNDKVEFSIEYYDLQVTSEGDRRRWEDEGTRGLAPLPIENFIRPFDLSKAPLLRVGLIQLPHTPAALRAHPSQEGKEHKYILLIDMHHIITDGTSHDILKKEFFSLYQEEDLLPLAPLRLGYKDFSGWQNREKQRQLVKQQEFYWIKAFQGELPVLNLPTDFPRPVMQSFEGNSINSILNEKETRTLKNIANENNATLFMVILSVFTILLSKLSGLEDIIVGIPIAARRHADLENIIGMFVNTLAMRNYPTSEKKFKQFLKEVKWRTLEAFENQDYQFEDLVEKVVINRDASRNPLFNVMFTMQHTDEISRESFSPGEKSFDYQPGSRIAKFDLTMEAIDAKERILLSMEYAAKLFKRETIERFTDYLKTLVSDILVSPVRKLSEINIIPVKEIQRILYAFNDTAVDYPQDKTIHQLFREQVEQTPDKIALVGPKLQITNHKLQTNNKSQITNYNAVSITYKELNQKSNQLAHLLRKKGVGFDTVVAIMLERSIEMIIGILGILKAGGVYMPIEPDFPQDRVNYMLKDSSAKILLTGQEIAGFYSHPLLPLAPATSLAYIIYTSGTTGWPKGVLIRHRNIVNTLIWRRLEYRMKSTDVSMQLLSFCFDAFVTCFFTPVISGARVILLTEEEGKDITKIREAIRAYNVTHFNAVPILVKALMETITVEEALFLQAVTLGGDKILLSLLEEIKRKNPAIEIFYEYGVTEASVISTLYRCQGKEDRITIGKPTANTAVVILDKTNHLQPLGVPGELCISGVGLARGYLNNPELTSERFISLPSPHHPNPPIPHFPIYLTGDRGRWLPDGNIEFLGRIDFQVKIRGFRIETGEIENQLLKYSDVTAAVVISSGDEAADKYLCAYIVSDKEISIPPLKEYLSRSLPYYMIPSYIIRVEKVPLTLQGKVDRKALPKPVIKKPAVHQVPGDWWEEQMILLWSEVLEAAKETLSIEANFFDMGGHSLKATILAAKIHKTFNVKLPLVEVFKQPTIREQARYIKNAVKDEYIPITPVEKQEYYELSPAQKRLYILQQLEPGSTSYNMPQTISLADETDIKKLESAFIKLIERHESLRTSFFQIDEKPVQKVHDKLEFSIEYFDLQVTGEGDRCRWEYEGTRGLAPLSIESADSSEQLAANTIRNFVRPFDLAQAPLLRVGLIELPHTPTALGGHPRRGTYISQERKEHKYILILDMHHIITDGTAQDILKKEFMALDQEELLPLALLRLQYKDFSGWQNSKKQRQLLKQQEFYWMKAFADELPVLNLPTDYPRPLMQSFEGNSVNFVLNEKQTRTLKKIAKQNKATLFMVILSLFTILLSKLSGQDDIIVGTPIAARRHADLENIIGMFVNTLALRNYPASEKKFNQFLGEVKWRTLEVFENQEYQFEDLVDRVSPRRDTSRNPIFDVMFNLLNQSDYTGPIQDLDDRYKDKPAAYQHRKGTSKFDLYLAAVDMGKRLFFNLEYCNRLFNPATSERIIGYFKKIVSWLSDNDISSIKLAEIEMVPEEEKVGILDMSRGIQEPHDTDTCIQRLFEAQVEKNPDRVALVAQNAGRKAQSIERNMERHALCDVRCAITYRELNRKSNQLAQLLREKGVKQDIAVGLMVERSIEMISGILAVMKAGGAYMPIDMEYPAPRKKYMLQDSQITLLLTNCEIDWASGIIPANIEIIDISDENIYRGNGMNLTSINRGSDLLYVIYTSGSTGNPKGVMLEHGNLVNLLGFQFKFTNIDCTGILQFTPISFDVSFQEIFSALLSSGVLYLVDRETRTNILGLFDVIRKNIIKTLFLPMSFLRFIFREEEYISLIPNCIEHIVTAGEQVIISNAFRDYLKSNHIYLHNHYGPSETHVVTTLTLDPGGELPERPSIGKPVLNTTIYILDIGKHLVPIGVPGEIYIGGKQVGRGYWDRPGLTAERFDQDLLDYQKLLRGVQGGGFLEKSPPGRRRQYKTGDLARWLASGNIEFLGRIDNQVKIRGFRVELGEIESRLLSHEGIEEAVVIARNSSKDEYDKYLCAYLVVSGGIEKSPPTSQLREYLSQTLPDFMIPSFFVPLERLPLNPNSKVDRKALPEPGVKLRPGADYTAPRYDMEEKLVEIWWKVLSDKNKTGLSIGIDDNFFELGGNSLKVIQLISEINKTFNIEVPMGLIFKTPFIRSISAHLMQHKFTAAEKEIVLSLSPGKTGSEKIFCFPPAIGYGIAYMGLVPLLSGYSLYGFNYIDDKDKDRNKMEKYIDTIMEIQPKGPYTLLGYSAGGRLCFKAAELLEKRGNQVKDIILVDCYSQQKSLPVDVAGERTREFKDRLKHGLKELGLEPMIDRVMNTLEKYCQYHDRLMAQDPVTINANIHLIKAEDKRDLEGFIGWEAFTRGEYHEYEGFGIHKEMQSADFIEKNAALINRILTSSKKETRPISTYHSYHRGNQANP